VLERRNASKAVCCDDLPLLICKSDLSARHRIRRRGELLLPEDLARGVANSAHHRRLVADRDGLATLRFGKFAACSGVPAHCLPQGLGQDIAGGQISTLEAARHVLKYGNVDRYGSGSFATWPRFDASPTCILGVVVVRRPPKRSESLCPSLLHALPRSAAGTFSLVSGS
jgi:hypothetical protein